MASSPLRTAFLGFPARSFATSTTTTTTTTARCCRINLNPSSSILSRSIFHLKPSSLYSFSHSARSSYPQQAQHTPQQPPNLRQQSTLDWNSFFALRLRRRRIQVGFSAISGILGFGVGVGVLGSGLAEPLVGQIPLDPFITLGGLTMVFVAVGWLVGPSIGSQVFYMMNRSIKPQIKKKEAEFFARIKKHRVDPSNSSASNPVPDFYGEKIQSVQGYRRWLKDQRAFNRKKSANFV